MTMTVRLPLEVASLTRFPVDPEPQHDLLMFGDKTKVRVAIDKISAIAFAFRQSRARLCEARARNALTVPTSLAEIEPDSIQHAMLKNPDATLAVDAGGLKAAQAHFPFLGDVAALIEETSAGPRSKAADVLHVQIRRINNFFLKPRTKDRFMIALRDGCLLMIDTALKNYPVTIGAAAFDILIPFRQNRKSVLSNDRLQVLAAAGVMGVAANEFGLQADSLNVMIATTNRVIDKLRVKSVCVLPMGDRVYLLNLANGAHANCWKALSAEAAVTPGFRKSQMTKAEMRVLGMSAPANAGHGLHM